MKSSSPTKSLLVSLCLFIVACGLLFVLVACGLTIFGAEVRSSHAVHVTAEEAPFDLPAGASDVSYCRTNHGIVAFEFTTDAASFRRWVDDGIGSWESQQAGVQVTQIAGGTQIFQCYYLSPQLNGPDRAIVTQGLEYEWSKEDRGVHAVFDSSTGRAYYYSHSR